jgi:DNA-binding transcriptional regulator YdaS (Cro superfamily)
METEHDLRDLLTQMVETLGSQKNVAQLLGISQPYLGDVLLGRRGIGVKLAKALGYERITVFKPINGKE